MYLLTITFNAPRAQRHIRHWQTFTTWSWANLYFPSPASMTLGSQRILLIYICLSVTVSVVSSLQCGVSGSTPLSCLIRHAGRMQWSYLWHQSPHGSLTITAVYKQVQSYLLYFLLILQQLGRLCKLRDGRCHYSTLFTYWQSVGV